MKKILLLIIAAVLVCCCDKLDDRLVGTTFRTEGYYYMRLLGYHYHCYEFTSTTEGVAYWADKDGKQNGSDGNITYRLIYPDIYIKDQNNEETHFRFNDIRSFSLVETDGSISETFSYYKQ